MICLGLDPSIKATGAAVVGSTRNKPTLMHASTFSHPNLTGLDRAGAQAADMLKLVDTYQPDLAVVEGYAYAPRSTHTLVALVELGTVLRYFLRQRGLKFMVVAPSSLKKFVLGTGKATKDQILKALYAKWGVDLPTHDQADAYGLARMGLASAGHPGRVLSEAQLDALAAMKWGG